VAHQLPELQGPIDGTYELTRAWDILQSVIFADDNLRCQAGFHFSLATATRLVVNEDVAESCARRSATRES